MSDETPAQDQETNTEVPEVAEVKNIVTRPPNPTFQLVGVVAAGILAFALLVWAQGVRTASVRREAFGRGVDGISAALAIPVIETGSRVNANRIARLQSILDSIQRSAKLQTITVTDLSGNVLASTDTSLQGQTLKDMVDVKSPSTQKEADGVIEATTAVETDNGNKVGALQIKVKL